MPKCPFCYREFGTHIHDPILLPDGSPYKWSDDTTLILEPDISQREYKGFNQIREDEIMELQVELGQLEVDNGVTPLTTFSPINISGKFQITGYHIKEMRDSIEKILTAISFTKQEYFNHDELGNHIFHPNGDKLEWTDPITLATDLEKFQVKAIHIEDLRHNIQSVYFRENWEDSPIGIWRNTFVTGQDSKAWNFQIPILPPYSGSSYLEVTSKKSAYFYLIPNLYHDISITSCVMRYSNYPVANYKIKSNAKLYFDIYDIDIPNNFYSPWEGYIYSVDCFYIMIEPRTFYSPASSFSITYEFNYDPTYFVGSGNGILKGTIGIGSFVYNLYDDLVDKYPSIVNYYNGVISSAGCYIQDFRIGVACTLASPTSIHTLEIDNIKINL